MRKDLQRAIRWTFGSQIVGARKMKIQPNKLSYIVNGHADPNDHEREALKKALGVDFFAEEKEATQTFVEKYLRSEVGALMTIAEPTKATK